MTQAVSEWEEDLDYLKETFYDRWGDFPWPDRRLPRLSSIGSHRRPPISPHDQALVCLLLPPLHLPSVSLTFDSGASSFPRRQFVGPVSRAGWFGPDRRALLLPSAVQGN